MVSGAARALAPGCPLPLAGIDLHLHSTFSDGLKTPAELCAMAKKAGVMHVALCDHDAVGGVPGMVEEAEKNGLQCIPGVEISTGRGGKMHVLCYGKNVLSQQMQDYLYRLAQERIGRAEAILHKLDEIGIVLPEAERPALLAMPSVGRAHIARELIKLGAVHTMQQAFDRYLLEGRPAYVPRTLLSTEQAVRDLRDMKVVPVIAHPVRMGLEWQAIHALIRSLKDAGLMGVECYHSSANARSARALEQLARQEGLLVTGGSDYHGDAGSTVRIGHLPAGWSRRSDDLNALVDAISVF